MALAGVLVVASDLTLRQSLEFALQAEGYEVALRSGIETAAGDEGFACLVLDETGLEGSHDEIARFCGRFESVVVLADRPDGWVRGLAQVVVAKPLLGSSVTAAVHSAMASRRMST